MPLSLPGAIVAAVVDSLGALTVTTAAGEQLPAGTVPVGTRAWPDEYGRLVLEAPNGEQTRLGAIALPTAPVYRGGGTVNGTALAGTPAVALARRWSAQITTDATGAATVVPPPAVFATLWSVVATSLLAGSLVAVTAATPAGISLQVWTGTAVLLGGTTLAKPGAPVQVMLEVAGQAPAS